MSGAAPAVSVAMTTYNGARYLQEQLASLAAQSMLPAELVVCDDGSSDATLALLADFAAVAPFAVRIARNASRIGYRANFMQAAALCRGDVIAFCDQDDTWHPEKLQRVLACFAADGDVLLVYHNAMLVHADGAAMQRFYATPPSPAVAPPLTLPPWHFGYGYALVFRRTLLAAAPAWAGVRDVYHAGQASGHDVFFFIMAATLGSVGYCHECLVQYRQHAAQTIGTAGRDAPGWLQRWRYRLEDRHRTYLHLGETAADYAAMFESLAGGAGDLPAKLRGRAAAGAAAWRAVIAALSHARRPWRAGHSAGGCAPGCNCARAAPMMTATGSLAARRGGRMPCWAWCWRLLWRRFGRAGFRG